MPKFIYIVASVDTPNTERAALLQALAARATTKTSRVQGQSPNLGAAYGTVSAPVNAGSCHDPGCISFRHFHVVAKDEDDAYLQGSRALGPKEGCVNWNDYVVRLEDAPKKKHMRFDFSRLMHNCLLLGLRNGWRYWRLENKAASDPTFVPILCEKIEVEAKRLHDEGDTIGAYCLEAWVKQCRAFNEKYHKP